MASISHEIKNDLAVMAENSGLLKDLAELAERKGAPLDPARVKALAGRIVERTRKSDSTIKNMNRFSHSVDEPCRTVNLFETVSLVAALAARLAAIKGAAIELAPGGEAVSLTTDPFSLANLLWRCLEAALEAAGAGGRVRVELGARSGAGGAALRIEARGGKGEAGFDPPEGTEELVERLGARMASGRHHGEILIELPASLK